MSSGFVLNTVPGVCMETGTCACAYTLYVDTNIQLLICSQLNNVYVREYTAAPYQFLDQIRQLKVL